MQGLGRRNTEWLTILLVALTFTACSSSRRIEAPSATGPEMNLSSANEDLGLSLRYILVPNGPGAWVKDAQWHEYQFTVRSLSDKTVSIERIHIVDPRGLFIDSSANPFQLEKTTETLASQYKDVAVSAAPAVLGVAALVGAGAVIGVVAPPALLVAVPAYGI